jgi:FHS family glucose/mannose:H+ symporter-like MFS transporter
MPAKKKTGEPMATSWIDPAARGSALGFLLAGVLMGVIGSLTVAWRYELDKDPRAIGLHFLALNASILLCGVLSQKLLKRISLKAVCVAACAVASLGFIELTLAAPPAHSAWRILGISVVGCGAGGLLTSLLHFLRPHYEERAASIINFCSLMFGLGCLLATTAIGAVYLLLQVRWQTLILAAVPVLIAPFVLGDSSAGSKAVPRENRVGVSGTLKELRSPAAILFSLLLFFQFGNEWALATWLPLFVIHRLGLSPQAAIFVLALYFLALIVGRLTAQALLKHINHAKLLFATTAAAMMGYLLLSFTESAVGAALATIVTGLAFAPVYALVAEEIGHRFDYEPGFFNGIFSLAVTGGMLMPWALGFAGYYVGMQYVLLIPAIGTVVVLILVLLIMLEAKLMRTDQEIAVAKTVEPAKRAATSAGRRA